MVCCEVDDVRMQFRVQLLFYNLSRNQKFDIFIMIFIMLNMITMAIEFEGMSAAYEKGLEYVNMTFLTIFTLECIIKVLGLRLYYFKEPWNVFDFVVVVISLLSQYSLTRSFQQRVISLFVLVFRWDFL